MYVPDAPVVLPVKFSVAEVVVILVAVRLVGASQVCGAAVVVKVPFGLLALITLFAQVVLTRKV